MKKQLPVMMLLFAGSLCAQEFKFPENLISKRVQQAMKTKEAMAKARAAFEPTVCPRDSSRLDYAPSLSITILEVFTNNGIAQCITTDRSSYYGSSSPSFSRDNYTYTPTGQVSRLLRQNKFGSIYSDNSQSTYTYNAADLVTVDLSEQMTGSQWQANSRTEYVYDAANNNTSTTYSYSQSGSLVPSARYTYTYNSGNYLTEELTEAWKVSAFQNQSKGSYTVNSAGGILKYQTWEWHVPSNSWRNSDYYAVTSTGSVINSYTMQTWDTLGLVWQNTERGTFTYDLAGNMLSQQFDMWTGSTWVPDSKYTFTYDSRDLPLTGLFQNYTGSSWENNSRYTSTYDQYGNQTLYLSENWDSNTNSWKLGFRQKDYFNCKTVGVKENFGQNVLRAYPQPVSDNLILDSEIRIESTVLRDLNGRVILQSGSTRELDLSHLLPGLYILNVRDESGQQQVLKVVKQ